MELFKWLRWLEAEVPDTLIFFYRKTDKHLLFITLDADNKWYAGRFSALLNVNQFGPTSPPDNKFQRSLIDFIFKSPYIRKLLKYQ